MIFINLFQFGNFTLASGKQSQWKIECDALTDTDWEVLALIASEILPPFGRVEGVPTGGIKFAKALEKYKNYYSDKLLIAEDVITTGGSMERFRNGRDAQGIAVFSRGEIPDWVTILFKMENENKKLKEKNELLIECLNEIPLGRYAWEWEEPAMDYVEVQLDKDLIVEIAKILAEEENKNK